jgi:molybdopterin-guanine dinucleotide biosynthesis protein A
VSHASTERDSTEPVTGVLLVGGGSTRFGSPKALARLGGRTLAELAWARLAWCDERIAVGKISDALPLPFPIRDDGCDVRAPLAGLVAGLRAARNDVVVALPVDTPLVTDAALQLLAAACAEAAVPASGPLPGAYRKAALPVLERRLHAGQLKLRRAVADLEARIVELDAAQLVNVNRVEDLHGVTGQRSRS